MPSVSRYSSRYTTRLMPDWMISLEHSRHGDAVTYSVAPSLLLPDFATLVMAFASACRT